MRRTALASILWWSQPPVLDPVEGRYRKHEPRDAQLANAAVARLREVILADNDLREVLLKGVEVRGDTEWIKGTKEQFPKLPASMQVRLLSALDKTNSPDLKEFVVKWLDSNHPEVREKARVYASKAGVPSLSLIVAVLKDPKPAGQGKGIKELAGMEGPEAEKVFQAMIERYRAGKIAPHWELELWQAAKSKQIQLKAGYDLLEIGGDPDRGKKFVMEHAAAQCIRCHRIGKVGSELGPDLSKIGRSRNRTQLVTSMLDPTREITDGYGTIVLRTKAGVEIAGVLSKKTKTEWIITLADGQKESVAPKEVESHTLTSTIPPMNALMKPEEILDVVSYLAGLKLELLP